MFSEIISDIINISGFFFISIISGVKYNDTYIVIYTNFLGEYRIVKSRY